MKKILLIALIFSRIHLFAQLPSFKAEGIYPNLYLNHKVVQGQHFLSLAKLYNLSPNVIATFNELKLSASLHTGENIKIPLTATNLQTYQPQTSNSNYIPLYQVLSEDEPITSISKRVGIADTLIEKFNPGESRTFKAGSKIVIGYLKVRKDQTAFLNTATENNTAAENNLPAPINSTVEIKSKDTAITDFNDFDSDKLFEQARHSAFEKKDYPAALKLCHMALAKSPGYSDIRIFAGRIYTWMDKPDSARECFNYVLQNEPDNKEVYIAYTDLEYWNDQYNNALQICEKGLSYNSNSKDLLIRKVKILKALKRPAEVQQMLESLLKKDPANTEARALLVRSKDEVVRNKIGFSYEYNYFDKQFNDPWHIASLDYIRQTKLGSVGGHIWYANRFRSGGLQYELEAYPHISKHLYGYVSGAYSDNVGVFPKYRSGVSLYGILPKSMEGEIGLRYLYFSDATIIYTAALSKYYKSWLFTGRTFITPGENNISHSYNLISRYYYGGADDYFAFTIGRGISPDDRQAVVLLNNKQYKNLITTKASVVFRHEFNKKYLLTIDAGWMNQEYRPETKGNQLSTGITYQVRF